MLKPLRQHRKDKLITEGFLKFEAQVLSKNRLDAPAMKELRKQRRTLLRADMAKFKKEIKGKALRKGQTPATIFRKIWTSRIDGIYATKKWYDIDGDKNPYVQLREIVDAFKFQHPDFRTPQPKRKSKMTPGEYKKRAGSSRKYVVTMTYEVMANSEEEAKAMAKQKTPNIKKINASEID